MAQAPPPAGYPPPQGPPPGQVSTNITWEYAIKFGTSNYLMKDGK